MIGSELSDVDPDIRAKINKTRPTYVYLQLYSITKLQNIHDRIGFYQTYNFKVSLISKHIQWSPLESLQVLFYEAKVPFSERCITM